MSYMLEREEFVKNIISRDKKIFKKDLETEPKYGEPEDDVKDEVKIIADFTEYSPLHNGHRHCMMEAKKQVPDGLFVAVVPGLFERSGRGLPYIMTRQARAEAAVAVGADIVVEGPPMGIMGSGQYSLCLAKTFQALDADHIPRGYKPFPEFEAEFKEILSRISNGHGVAPKPYKFVDMQTKEILMEGKLDEDNYVIVSLSKSLKKIGFDFKDKFIFIERIEGVSGTKIREAVLSGHLEDAEDMLPSETIQVLRREIDAGRAPLHNLRDADGILQRVNESSQDELRSLALMDDKTSKSLIENRPFYSLGEVETAISQGFSRHHRQRVLSSLEAGVFKEMIHNYIDRYPSVIRILKYKNKEVLKEFRKRIPHRRLEICQ
ncbi:putative nucleotidyltransferase [Methanobacterium aggregans]|nr:putative nucleotidyltransferase [Methanobacterium aggregans]